MGLANYPKLGIVILNYNSLTETVRCIESLRRSTYPRYEIVVVDNASHESEGEGLRRSLDSSVHVILNPENIGYARGNNVGIDYSLNELGADYVLILNPDTVVDEHALTNMIEVAEKSSDIGLVNPVIYSYENPSEIIHIGDRINWYLNAGFKDLSGMRRFNQEAIDIQLVSGTCMLIKRPTIQRIGKLPEEYFFWWEECDYSVRSMKVGLRNICATNARVFHKTHHRSLAWKSREGGMFFYRHLVRGRFIFFMKYASPLQLVTSTIYYLIVSLPFLLGRGLVQTKNPRLISVFFHALVEGIRSGSRSRTTSRRNANSGRSFSSEKL